MIKKDLRLEALKRFAAAITILNIAGHLFLGFEQSWAHPFAGLLTAYSLELLFEWLNCRINGFKPRYAGGGFKKLVLFLLPGHISGLAVSMLLFSNEQLMPVILGTAIAILSKHIFRVQVGNAARHFLNPSNTGIAVILLLFPWVGIAPPYQFTENLIGPGDWILPVIFISVGSLLNTKLTKRMPLILAWFAAFALQGILRGIFLQTPVLAALNPMSGVAFLLFSFYMISDPATTPAKIKNQVFFGASVAFVYSILVCFHIVFGQFFALLMVCSVRGFYLWVTHLQAKPLVAKAEVPILVLEPKVTESILPTPKTVVK